MFKPRRSFCSGATSTASSFLHCARPFSTSSLTEFVSTKVLNAKATSYVAVVGALSIGAGITAGTVYADDTLHAPEYPWNHKRPWESFDHASIRRGHQVFSEVCSACHSVSLIAYRNLVDVAYTEEEVKAIAASHEVEDGPDDEGEMFLRPGKMSDYFPRPYKNEQAARAANGGALPPDLSLMIKARPGKDNYVFQLLTGYRKKPAGVNLREGLHWNPYFPGGAIGMPPPLMPDMLTYEDGTPATVSQMAKDVTTFLCWTASPEHDDRKKMAIKAIFILSLIVVPTLYYKRLIWSVLKTRKIIYR